VSSSSAHASSSEGRASGFRRLVSHLAEWVTRGEATVAAAEEVLRRMDAAAARVRVLVSRLPVGTPEPKPEVATRPAVASPPEPINTSSAIDFGPREHPSTWGPKKGKDVTPLGDGEGYKTGKTVTTTRVEGNTVGVTGGA
jgi:hypothetical protein